MIGAMQRDGVPKLGENASKIMHGKTIAIIAALDTKGAEAQFIERIIHARGHRSLVIDIGVLGDSQYRADVECTDVAHEGGGEPDNLRRRADKAQAMDTMTRGAGKGGGRFLRAPASPPFFVLGG